MSGSQFERTRGEQIKKDIRKSAEYRQKARIDKAIQAGYRAIYEADHHTLALVCRDHLIRELDVTRQSLREYAESVTESGEEWNHVEVRRFVENPGRYIQFFAEESVLTDELIAREFRRMAEGAENPATVFRDVVEGAFYSLESIAITEGYVTGSVTNWAPATGYELQTGILYQPPRGDMPDEVQLVKPGDSEEVTVCMGMPGRGKGMSGHTETEDRYAAGRKIIDLVDMDECEGATMDIPQCIPELRRVREEMGLAPDFTEIPELDPDLEIMVPLTRNLSEEYIPFNGEDPTDTVVRPFTVPAASLSKRALKRFIGAELTKQQEALFERAYESVDRRYDDWSLVDLAHQVEHAPQDNGAGERVMRLIKSIANQGWIRTRDHPLCIDWERILTSPEKITVFTASKMGDKDVGKKYLLVSYLVYGLRRNIKKLKNLPHHVIQNRDWDHVPKLTVVARELHKVAPNNETAAADARIREVQKAIASDFRDLTAMHRHEGVEIIADTQNFIGEIKARARKNFNRAILFETQFSPAKSMFLEIAGETGERDKYPRRVKKGFDVGESAVLGRVGTGRPFEMTVAWAPSASYHFDPDDWNNVNTGWDARVHLLGEDYRKAGELVDALMNPDSSSDGEGADSSGGASEDVDPADIDVEKLANRDEKPDEPVGAFAWDHLESRPNHRLVLDDLMTAYHQWARDHERNQKPRQVMGQKLGNSATPEDDSEIWKEVFESRRLTIDDHPDDRRTTRTYEGVALTESGEDLLDRGLAWEKEQGWTDVDPDEREYKTNRLDYSDIDTSADADVDANGGGSEDQDTSADADSGEDAPADPASEEIDCSCSTPRPVAMYSGDGADGDQVGWKCENCSEKEFF